MQERPTQARPSPGPVVLSAPAEGWTSASYQAAIEAFTRERKRAPRTVTMHPETLEAVVRTKVIQTEQALIDRVDAVLEQEAQRLEHWVAGERQSLQVCLSQELERGTLILE
jgi:hypothetical protein